MVVIAQGQESTKPMISPLYINLHLLFLTRHDAKEKQAWGSSNYM